MARRGRGSGRRPEPDWVGSPASRRLARLIGVAAAVCFLVIAGVEADRDHHLRDTDRTAQATVLERVGKQFRISYTTDDGRTVVTELDAHAGTDEGDLITVRYHPDDPAHYVMDVRNYFWPYVMSVFSVATAGFVLWLTWVVAWP